MARRRGQRVARAVDELRANLRIRQVVYVVVQHPQPGWRSGERLWAAGEPAKSRGKAASAHDQPLLVCLRDVSDEAHDAVVFHSAQELVHHVSLKETGAQAALVRLVPLGVGIAVEPREKAFEYLGREVDVAERVARLELQAGGSRTP